MRTLTRRQFCSGAAAVGVAACSKPQSLIAQENPTRISFAIDAATSIGKVADDFMGLSYESGQLAYPDFFSAQNSVLVELFRSLSPSGVLRLGGNLSEFTIWSETEPTTAPEAGGLVGPDPGHRAPRTFTITPHSIRNLQEFLQATGWRCIYGLNLGGGTVEQAVAEGAFVARTLGSKLICVQFGNEPDLFKHRDRADAHWTYQEYLAKWKVFRAAFHEKLPRVAVAGPDTAANQEWVKQFVNDTPKEIVLVTSHYYPLGPPTDPNMTIDRLLHPGAHYDHACGKAIETAKAAGLPFRMAEGNSCYNAGKPGVSDTFASALWAGDFCLQLASSGCVGVNLHSGAYGYYSPIVGSAPQGFAARPEYYGLMLAQQFAGLELRRAKLTSEHANVTAYAAGGNKGLRLAAIFNKDAQEAVVDLSGLGVAKQATVALLKAPAIDSKTGTTFDGAEVDADGKFHGKGGDREKVQDGTLSVKIPAYSAALIRLA